mgnify:CR=1 FL=1
MSPRGSVISPFGQYVDMLANDLLDPFSNQPFKEPVIAEDGYTYEKEHLERWFAQSGPTPLSPKTRTPMGTRSMHHPASLALPPSFHLCCLSHARSQPLLTRHLIARAASPDEETAYRMRSLRALFPDDVADEAVAHAATQAAVAKATTASAVAVRGAAKAAAAEDRAARMAEVAAERATGLMDLSGIARPSNVERAQAEALLTLKTLYEER